MSGVFAFIKRSCASCIEMLVYRHDPGNRISLNCCTNDNVCTISRADNIINCGSFDILSRPGCWIGSTSSSFSVCIHDNDRLG